MPVINYTQSNPVAGNHDFMLITWAGMANGDTGQPFILSQYADRSAQIEGTFGVGGTIIVQGTNDTVNWRTLNDPYSNPISVTSPNIEAISELVGQVRPAVTAGDGTTSITVTMLVRKAS